MISYQDRERERDRKIDKDIYIIHIHKYITRERYIIFLSKLHMSKIPCVKIIMIEIGERDREGKREKKRGRGRER